MRSIAPPIVPEIDNTLPEFTAIACEELDKRRLQLMVVGPAPLAMVIPGTLPVPAMVKVFAPPIVTAAGSFTVRLLI